MPKNDDNQIQSGLKKLEPEGKIATGVVHSVPSDLRKALEFDSNALSKWNDLTPLARNEWICWLTFVKKDETRKEHVKRTISELKEGMRRPCCWIGCIHRTDKAISPSVQGVLNLRLLAGFFILYKLRSAIW